MHSFYLSTISCSQVLTLRIRVDDHPLHAEFVFKTAKIVAPDLIGDGHFDLTAGAKIPVFFAPICMAMSTPEPAVMPKPSDIMIIRVI